MPEGPGGGDPDRGANARSTVSRAYLGLGSNLGDKIANISAALDRLDAAPGITIAHCSGLYRTPPWGDVDQGWFLNAAAAVETSLAPHDLLEVCLEIERGMGRVRERRWGPRLIDMDLLVYDGAFLKDDRLTLPHPHLLARAFVLVPLLEVAPDLNVGGIRIAEALTRLDVTGIKRVSSARSRTEIVEHAGQR